MAIYKRKNTQKFSPILIKIKNCALSKFFVLRTHMNTQNEVLIRQVRRKGRKRERERTSALIHSLFFFVGECYRNHIGDQEY